jgi:hypothetical protein
MSTEVKAVAHIEHGQVVGSNVKKDPDDWSTGDEPMTGAQLSYLKTLAEEAGEDVPENLSKAEASKEITRLQGKTHRGDPDTIKSE